MDSNKEDQINEVMALSEICGEGEFHMYDYEELKQSKYLSEVSKDKFADNAGYIEIKPYLRESSIRVIAANHKITVKFLPPVVIEFILPEDYPSDQPPKFDVSASWMSQEQLKMVKEKLLNLWSENVGCVVLYSWYDFLKESLVSFLGISEVLDLSEMVSKHQALNEKQKIHTEETKSPEIQPDLSTPTCSAQNLKEENISNEHNISKQSGVVVKWQGSRGFGFIASNGSNYFFHIKSCEKDLKISLGLEVLFDCVKSTKKPGAYEAHNVASRKIVMPGSELPKITVDSVSSIKEKSPSDKVRSVVADVQIKPNLKKVARLPPILKTLSEYNLEEGQRFFESSFHLCNVCFSKKQGSVSIAFPGCNHVYCKDCMKDYFKVQIEDGQYSNLTCPEEKCTSQALPNQVKGLVSEKLFELYERQLLATTLESMTDILPCPRPGCQCPTLIDREASMGRCPSCKHTFCIYCKAAFHGIDPCRIRSELFDDYVNSAPSRKAHLEKIYGKKQLTSMVNTMLSEKYISNETKPCPKCRAPIEKFAGCNKMTCNKCQTYFCYICGDKLPESNPYLHFRDLSKSCFNKLFEGVADDDDDEGNEDGNFDPVEDFEDDHEDGEGQFVGFYMFN